MGRSPQFSKLVPAYILSSGGPHLLSLARPCYKLGTMYSNTREWGGASSKAPQASPLHHHSFLFFFHVEIISSCLPGISSSFESTRFIGVFLVFILSNASPSGSGGFQLLTSPLFLCSLFMASARPLLTPILNSWHHSKRPQNVSFYFSYFYLVFGFNHCYPSVVKFPHIWPTQNFSRKTFSHFLKL